MNENSIGLSGPTPIQRLPVNLQVNSRVKRDKDSRLVLESAEEAAYQGGVLWERTPR